MKNWKMMAAMAVAAVIPGFGQSGTLKVKVDPTRAGVFVDGKYLGPATNFGFARVYPLDEGTHELILREPRYEDLKMQVTIRSGSMTTLKEHMKAKEPAKPPFGTLRVTGFEKYAPVYINGEFMGHADEFDASRQGLLLNPGDYDLKVTSPTGATLLQKKITIKENAIEVEKKS